MRRMLLEGGWMVKLEAVCGVVLVFGGSRLVLVSMCLARAAHPAPLHGVLPTRNPH